ncbi:MAG TPA: hypothetical protein VGF56_05690 [Rhizomicrobium sp.]|jgi:hypothetical protein
MNLIDTLLGRASQREQELSGELADKRRLHDTLKADPALEDPEESTDTHVHSLVCRRRNVLNRLSYELVTVRLDLLDERSANRNSRTFSLLVGLILYLICKSIIPWDDVVSFAKLFGLAR